MLKSPHFNVHLVAYADDRVEYAWKVREEISRYKDENPVIVVDLPEGYEDKVLTAVKRLPAISLLVDPLKRGISIHPGNPPIEAVRSYLDYGLDCFFIDTCFPCSGSGENWEKFQTCVAQYGLEHTLEHAEQYHIDIAALIGLQKNESGDYLPAHFFDDPEITEMVSSYTDTTPVSPYYVSRQQYMAARLKKIVTDTTGPVIFVCNIRHIKQVLKYLENEKCADIMRIHMPVTSCRVRESSISLITHEIPFFIYLYELYRDCKPERKKWIKKICADALESDNPSSVRALIQNAGNLALTEGMMYPDLSTLLISSLSCCSPEYTRRLLDIALQYPPADKNPNCEIIPVLDMNFQVLQSKKYLFWTERIHKNLHSASKKNTSGQSPLSTTFNRTEQSLEDERRWMRYIKSRYQSLVPGDQLIAEPYSSGLAEGIDLHEIIKHTYSDNLFVKEKKLENKASYVFYFGGTPDWQIYYDRQNLMAATAKRDGNRFTVTSLVAFLEPVQIKRIYHDVNTWNPLYSAITAALSHSTYVFLFSEKKPDLKRFGSDLRRINWVDLKKIPLSMQEKIRVFYVT